MKMNKLALATLAILSTCAMTLNSVQAAAKPDIKKGIIVGFSSSNIGGSDGELFGVAPEARNNIAIGGYMLEKNNDKISTRLDVYLAQKGGRYNFSGNEFNVNLTYLQEDITVLYKLPLPIKQSVNLMGGGFLAVNLLASAETVISGASDTTDMKDSTSTFDAGLVIGASVSLTDKISVDARYGLGLLSFDSGSADMKNNGFLMTAGYTFK